MPKTVCFTGHRPDGLFGYDPAVQGNQQVIGQLRQIIRGLVEQGYDRFVTGGALGIDQWAATLVVGAKDYAPHIKLVVAIPFNGFEVKWPQHSQELFAELIHFTDEFYAICPPGYSAIKMQLRNQWMVQQSELVVAVWTGKPGGTANCVQYARSMQKDIVYLNPQTGQIVWPGAQNQKGSANAHVRVA